MKKGTDNSTYGEAENIEVLRYRLEIAELKLKVAELEKEITELRAIPHWWWTAPSWIVWPPYYSQPVYRWGDSSAVYVEDRSGFTTSG